MNAQLKMFIDFIQDESASDMFITGFAGTGKTTDLGLILEYCLDEGIECVTCAYTHKACKVLRSKLPLDAKIRTLHSYLRKRPTVNTEAEELARIEGNAQHSMPDAVQVLFVDEFSCIGEKDLMDIRALQDTEDGEGIAMKVVWLGDLYQLPPVKDQQTIEPNGKYQIKLTEQKRRSADNPLGKPIMQLISFIDGAKPEPLVESDALIRGEPDIVGAYIDQEDEDKVLLAYTNARVQEMNIEAQGYSEPKPGDKIFSSSLHDVFTFIEKVEPWGLKEVDSYRDAKIKLGSQYKTLEFLIDNALCEFYKVEDEDGLEFTYPVIFGTNNYKLDKEESAHFATRLNKQISNIHKPDNVTEWARQNNTNPLARQRALAWRKYLTVNEAVMSFDFNHALTVHKSQGSTFNYVYMDTENVGICSNWNYQLYLKLM